MKDTTLYSIGHGNKTIDVFIEELKAFDIEYLIDIRSKPFSKWSPHFNQNEIKHFLEKNAIKYVYLGDILGGLPQDRTCYNDGGQVVYDLIKDKDFFKEGLKRLLTANEKNIKLTIMCSESKPDECHRTKLIGQELLRNGISLKHIINKDLIKPQELVMTELTKGKSLINLFDEEIDLKSKKSY